MIPADRHLHIGSILFDGLDQIDFTGPFEVLSRIPNSTLHVAGKTTAPVRDTRGLTLVPDKTFAEVPKLDVLHVPGGPGQEALMEDEETLAFIRRQAEGALFVFSVCSGALVCGAAGLLKGRRATTHWAPERAPAAVVAAAREMFAPITARRLETARRVGGRLGLTAS